MDHKTLKINKEASIPGNIDDIYVLARRTVINHNKERAIKRQELNQLGFDNITHLETLIPEYPELSFMIEHKVVVNGAVTQPGFYMSLTEVTCRYLAFYVSLMSAANSEDVLSAHKRVYK